MNSFINKFRKLGFIGYNGGLQVHSLLLGVVLHDSSGSASRRPVSFSAFLVSHALVLSSDVFTFEQTRFMSLGQTNSQVVGRLRSSFGFALGQWKGSPASLVHPYHPPV